jgi:serine/threonine protein kinase
MLGKPYNREKTLKLTNKMFKKPQLIVGRDLDEQLIRTLEMCGSSHPLLNFIHKEQLLVNPKIQLILSENKEKEFNWESMVNANNQNTFDLEGIDLMKKMLHMDPEQRISVQKSLEHPFLN